MAEILNGFTLTIILLGVVGVVLLWRGLTREDPNVAWEVLVITKPEAKAIEASLLELTRQLTAEHAHALYIKSKQLVVHDAYGNRDQTRYFQEIDYFIDAVLGRDDRLLDIIRPYPLLANAFARSLAADGQATLRAKVARQIYDFIDCYELITGKVAPDFEAIDPLEFEALCAQAMGQAGWDAKLTKGSGDQGADIICHKEGRSLVLQCKLYASPIGNKAVQEAFAARSFYGLDRAAVVTNQSYTRSAVELANTTGVLLLHFHDLDRIDVLLAQHDPA